MITQFCSGFDFAMIHLENFVANLIRYFHWIPPNGYCGDLSEKLEFIVIIKNRQITQISSRVEKLTRNSVGRWVT